MTETELRVPSEHLEYFCVRVFERAGVSATDARLAAEVTLASDLRGIASHGVAHLPRYVNSIRSGITNSKPQEKVIAETPATATIEADAGLGQPVSVRAMQRAIEKARAVGAGFVSVRNSNHFGIAGYYAMMALEHDCIGIAMTNASPRVVPTFGRDAILGTNPIAVAAPALKSRPFVLDMATSAVAQGKIEIAEQLGKKIPEGWAIDKDGKPTTDAPRTLEELRTRAGGGLLPLGGASDLLSGYKGYGLGLWVEIFTALLSGAAFATHTYPKTPEGKPLPGNLGHFFGAWRVDAFRPLDEFKGAMDELQQLLKNAPKEPGRDRIFIAGEKEFEAMEQNLREGVPLNRAVVKELRALAKELNVETSF